MQRDQFLRVNNTRPLPRGLITELLPAVSSPLPPNLEARKIPSALCDALNTTESSPFYGQIKRASTSQGAAKQAVIADTSLVKMLQESLSNPSGCLFAYRNIATGETDFDGVWQILLLYWSAVKDVFPDAWGKPPTKSRLMHGTGLRAMGRLMDRVMAGIDPRHPHAARDVRSAIEIVAPECRWTHGRWEELGDLNWDEIQNVPRHIRILSNHLIRLYVQRRGR